jgi:primase-polymerase (primpol)-like protein
MSSAIGTERFPHYPQTVPSELKAGERWVTCDEHKVPLIAMPNGACFAASTTNTDTWRSYETALKAYSDNEHIAGIGRVITDDEDYVGVDLDDCLDPGLGAALVLAAVPIPDEILHPLRELQKVWRRL